MKKQSTQNPIVTLDRDVKTMLKKRADGEELKNKNKFTIDKNSVALFHHTVKGKQNQRFCDWEKPPVQNLRTNYLLSEFVCIFKITF